MIVLPPLNFRIQRAILLSDLVDGKIIMEPVGLSRLWMHEAKCIGVFVNAMSRGKSTNNQMNNVLQLNKLRSSKWSFTL